jgi:hypothetical protein
LLQNFVIEPKMAPTSIKVAGCGKCHCGQSPPPSAHFRLFGGRKQTDNKTSHHQRLNRLTSINIDIVHANDGNVDLIWRISAETTAKISWGLVTPC